MEGTPVGRRVVLGMMGTGVAGILFGSKAADVLGRLVSRDGTGLASLLPVGRFRIYTVTGKLHRRSEADYRLHVGGFVDTPVTLTLDDLEAMPATRMTKDFQCVTGWRVQDVKWAGVRLADLLDRAGVKEGAQGVRFGSFDGVYTETLTMEQARRDDVIVAYEMEGRPLTSAHGGPARLYVAPMYGYKSIKWLETIEVSETTPRPGYWEVRGYDIDGWVGRSNGRDDDPI
ncbi:MAG TPA: molybdopterin-dependent oxidoreductase [Acidimicrobiales bacterium]|nr:molybdopterin-dependent oxidoreductase [Acidimicrobiales bacterium]